MGNVYSYRADYALHRDAIPYITDVYIKRVISQPGRASQTNRSLLTRIRNTIACWINQAYSSADDHVLETKKSFKVSIFVPRWWTTLFKLRLVLLGSPLNDFVLSNNRGNVCILFFAADNVAEMELFSQCIGAKVKRVWITDYDYGDIRTATSNLLDGLQIDTLEVETHVLCEDVAESLINLTCLHRIGQIDLTVQNVSIADPLGFLLALSSQLRSLRIKQEYINDRDDDASFFFGIHQGDWAAIVLRLFSGKLDKLNLYSPYYEEFLNKKSAECLINKLPTLGKKIWFEATCKAYEHGLCYTTNDYTVKAFSPAANSVVGFWSSRTISYLTVKHISRERELFWDL